MSVCLLQFAPEDLLQFDAEISLSPTLELEATEYPTESGNVLTSSIIRRPRTWQIRAKVSDSPLVASLQPPLPNGQSRTSAIWSRLRQAQSDRQTFQYTDDRDIAEVAFISSVSDSRSVNSAGSLDLTITIREILIAVVRVTSVRLAQKGYGGKRQARGEVVGNKASTSTIVDAQGNIVLIIQANGQAVSPDFYVTNPPASNLMTGTPYNPTAIKPPAPVLPQPSKFVNLPADGSFAW